MIYLYLAINLISITKLLQINEKKSNLVVDFVGI